MFKAPNQEQSINNLERYHKLSLCARMGRISTVAKFAIGLEGYGLTIAF